MSLRYFVALLSTSLLLVISVLVGCSKDVVTPQEPSASTVIIGKQEWMTKNLDVSRFRNGDTIPEAKTVEQWIEAGRNHLPVWCYYNHDATIGRRYGRLYNWYAVTDPRGIAPVGFHVPTDAEWSVLVESVGGYRNAGTVLKASSGWKTGSGDNVAGFWALPAGIRDDDGFELEGSFTAWWTTTENDDARAWMRLISAEDQSVNMYCIVKAHGLSVRCVKD